MTGSGTKYTETKPTETKSNQNEMKPKRNKTKIKQNEIKFIAMHVCDHFNLKIYYMYIFKCLLVFERFVHF